MMILLVEDNPADVIVISKSMAISGRAIEIVVSRDTSQALGSLFAGTPPEVVLISLDSPEIDYRSIIRRVRSNDGTMWLPVLLLISSAERQTGAVMEMIAAGADDWVVKGDVMRLPLAIDALIARQTCRRQMETQRSTQEHLLSDAISIAGLGWYSFDISSGRWESSATLDEILGIDSNFDRSVSGWTSLLHPSSLDEIAHFSEEILGKRQPLDREYRILRQNTGEERWVQSRGKLEFDLNGQPMRLIGTVRDVTDHRRMEDTLRLQAAVMEAAAYATIITRLDGTIEWLNSAFTALTQYSWDEAIGKNPRELVKSGVHDRAFFKQLWDTILRGEVWQGEIVNRRKDGSIYYEDQMIAPLRDERGEIRHFVAMKQDVTSRKQAEEALQLSHSILSQVASVVYVVDREGAVIYVSPSVENLLGFSPQELQDNGWWNRSYIFPDQSEAERSSAIRVARGEAKPRLKSFERRVRTKAGSTKLMLWTESTASGNLTVRVGSDITEQRQIEYQFRQSQKMEAIGQLAGGVAHDFNNLLTVINGYSEILLEALPPGDDYLRHPLLAMQKAGSRAASLTRQLLAFSRKEMVVPTIVDLNSVVNDLETMLSRLIGEDISLVTVLDASLKPVRADAGQIEQVVMNLVVNAGDAMPRGGKLTIETANAVLDELYTDIHVDVVPGEYSALIVSDTGSGMDEKTKAHIFEPFFTTKEAGKGTGLGLAVVHGILKQWGGHIQVYSEVGLGTTFKIYLPISETPMPPTERAHSQPVPRGSETVLVAEDEDAVRAIIRHVLTACGYTVLEARDGIEALKIAEDHTTPIQLLISDVVMPNMSGRELSVRVAKIRPALKVLFLSGYTDDTVIRHGILDSNIAFLQKPFTSSTLANKVREILDSPTGVV